MTQMKRISRIMEGRCCTSSRKGDTYAVAIIDLICRVFGLFCVEMNQTDWNFLISLAETQSEIPLFLVTFGGLAFWESMLTLSPEATALLSTLHLKISGSVVDYVLAIFHFMQSLWFRDCKIYRDTMLLVLCLSPPRLLQDPAKTFYDSNQLSAGTKQIKLIFMTQL